MTNPSLWLWLAAATMTATAFVHALLGERRLIGPLIAARAGVRPDDVITEVDGKPASEVDVSTLEDWLGAADRAPMKLSVRRGDDVVDLRLER